MSEENNNNEKENKKSETKAGDVAKKSAASNKEKKASTKQEVDKVTPKKDKEKDKDKVGFFVEMKRYLRGVVSEVKKVHWLGPKETVIYTIVVFVAVLFVGSLIWIFDMILNKLLALIM